MEGADRQFLIERLQQSRTEFLDAIAGITEEQARSRPAPDRWSVLDCAEHVATAERGLLAGFRNAAVVEAKGASELEAKILAQGANRSRRVEAPERARPSGGFDSLAQAVTAFQDAREATIQFVECCTTDLRACTVPHPLRGQVTGYECLLLIIMHPIRHAAQIREIRSHGPLSRD
jgi:uncharacterized damage-inducible protein DinB